MPESSAVVAWDAHAHWFAPKVSAPEAQAALARAFASGLSGVFLGGIAPSDWEPQERLSAQFPGRVIPCFGLHPWWVAEEAARLGVEVGTRAVDDALASLRTWVAARARAEGGARFGIGEIGLDRTRGGDDPAVWALQERVLTAGLELAAEFRAPVVLHGVEALPALLAAVQAVAERRGPVRGLLHRYSGSLEQARDFLKQGFLISVSPAVARPHAHRLHRVVAGLRPGELLFESDGPDAGDSTQIWDSARAVAELHRAAGSPWDDPEVWLSQASQSLHGLWPTEALVR